MTVFFNPPFLNPVMELSSAPLPAVDGGGATGALGGAGGAGAPGAGGGGGGAPPLGIAGGAEIDNPKHDIECTGGCFI